jgi:predicted ATPase/DNA-binding SARP family transcriptional activator
MARLSIALFGVPRVALDGAPLDITTRKTLALLAYLALTGAAHTRDALATIFWPEADGQRARGMLRTTLAQLKAALGDQWLLITREQIGLVDHPNLVVDVRQVEALHARAQSHNHLPRQACADCAALLELAVALHRSPLLAGFSLPDSPSFDDWLFFEGERLRHLLIDALATLITHEQAAGTAKAALPHALRWLALDPLEEGVNQLLIQLYIDTNQPSAARRHYAVFAKLLNDELGLEPDPATRAVLEQLAEPEPRAVFRQSAPASAAPLASAASPRAAATLPIPATSFVGRAHELDAIDTLLSDSTCRLLTLLGHGGSGKTRLALAVARARLDYSGDEVVFVSLAGLSTPNSVAATIAAALGCSTAGGDPSQLLLAFLRERSLLLILDSLDHVLERDHDEPGTVATLLDAIVQTAPGVQVLATSRVRLHLYEEQVYPVHGLDFPDVDGEHNAESYGAVQLFVQRARRVRPDFALTPDTIQQVVQIVRLLSGQPLALELAAAWVSALSLDQIASELRAGIDLLECDARNIPARHRSMRATYALSWQQLQPEEQAVQQALVVFRSGWTREAAASVASATPHLLQALIDQSLLQQPQAVDGSMRYEMHELLRQYAAEKLALDPQLEAQVRDRHAAFYLALMESTAATAQERPESRQWAQLQLEHDNQLAALQWRLSQQDSERSIRLCNALTHLWDMRGQVSEARYWLRVALALPAGATPVARADALATAGRLAIQQGDWPEATELLSEALFLSRDLGDTQRLAGLLRAQGWRALMRGDYTDAASLLEESVALYRTLTDQLGIARALGLQGQVAYEQGGFAQAIPLLTESMLISRALDDPIDTAWSINKLGLVALYQGNIADADRLLTESLAIFERIDHKGGIAWVQGSLGWVDLLRGATARADERFTESLLRYSELEDNRNIAFSLERLACLAHAQGQLMRAARLFGAAAALRDAHSLPLPPADKAFYARFIAPTVAAPNAAAIARARAEGAGWSIEQVTAYALQKSVTVD